MRVGMRVIVRMIAVRVRVRAFPPPLRGRVREGVARRGTVEIPIMIRPAIRRL